MDVLFTDIMYNVGISFYYFYGYSGEKQVYVELIVEESGGNTMNISNIKVVITEKDLNSIITDVLTEYVHIDGLKIDKILIDEKISVSGSYKYKVSILFNVDISIKKVENNTLYLSIEKINVKNLRIFKGIINTVLKIISSKFEEYGIEFSEDLISIHFDKLCKVIPMVEFSLKDLRVIPFGLEAEVGDFNFNSDKVQASSEDKIKKQDIVNEPKEIENKKDNTSNMETEDTQVEEKDISEEKEYTYRRFRKELKNRFSEKNKKYYSYVVLIPDITALLFRLYKDQRVTKEIKTNISIALGYLMFPLDIIPDVIPFIGKIDDIAIVFFILQKILCDIPEEVVLENWEGDANIIELSREAMALFNDKFGSKEIKKVVDCVRIAMKKTTNFFVK